jgi:hypothetical protein
MIDPGVWIQRTRTMVTCLTQDETDDVVFLGLLGETVREKMPGVEGV